MIFLISYLAIVAIIIFIFCFKNKENYIFVDYCILFLGAFFIGLFFYIVGVSAIPANVSEINDYSVVSLGKEAYYVDNQGNGHKIDAAGIKTKTGYDVGKPTVRVTTYNHDIVFKPDVVELILPCE